jgi:hypothetical protein
MVIGTWDGVDGPQYGEFCRRDFAAVNCRMMRTMTERSVK